MAFPLARAHPRIDDAMRAGDAERLCSKHLANFTADGRGRGRPLARLKGLGHFVLY